MPIIIKKKKKEYLVSILYFHISTNFSLSPKELNWIAIDGSLELEKIQANHLNLKYYYKKVNKTIAL